MSVGSSKGSVAGAVKAPFVRSPYNYDVEAASNEAAIAPVGESLTVQSMAEDADINVLMRRYGVTGKMPENPRLPSYGDFSGVSDYRTALQVVMDAEEAFGELPAEVRQRFQNDPQLLLEFVEDVRNLDEARRLGLVNPAPVVGPPLKVEVVQSAVAAANAAANADSAKPNPAK